MEGQDFYAHVLHLHQNGDFHGAVIGYRRLLRNRVDPALFHNLGVALSELERWDEARIAYEESLRLRPFSASTRSNLGLCLRSLGRLFEAETVLRDLLADDPWNIDVATNLAGVLLEQGRPDTAIQLLSPIVRRTEQHPIGWDTLGSCFLDEGILELALPTLARAYQQNPSNPDILFHLFAPLCSQNPSEGLALLQHGLTQHPKRWDWSFYLSAYAQWLGEHEKSLPVETPDFWRDSWEYALQNRQNSTHLFTTVVETLNFALDACTVEGLCLEFGTRFGTSARMIQRKSNDPLFVFDSFEGLPLAWHSVPKGAYSTGGRVPNLGPTVHPIVGWYAESLPPFLSQHCESIRFVHIDCDLYESTHDVLSHIHSRLVVGSILVFDEYWMAPHWREDEWKAWQECVKRHGLQYEYLAFSLLTRQAVLRIVSCTEQ